MSIHHAHNAHSPHHHHRRSLHSPREAPTTAESMPRHFVRNTDNSTQSTSLTPSMINLLIALLVLVIVIVLAIVALFVLRVRRARQRSVLASQAEKLSPASSNESLPAYRPSRRTSHRHSHHRLAITAAPYGRNSTPIVSLLQNEKEKLIRSETSPPTSPIPEIHITFPEEEDEMGKRKSGRVVVVKVSELGGMGLEPLGEEGLPAYRKDEGWKELDLEVLGGLKERERGRQ